jgi:hypothetical protein
MPTVFRWIFQCFSSWLHIVDWVRIRIYSIRIAGQAHPNLDRRVNFFSFWSPSPWFWIRVRFDLKCWFWICIETNSDPKHSLKLFRKPVMTCTSETIDQWERVKAGTEILMRLSEQFLKLVRVFIEARVNFTVCYGSGSGIRCLFDLWIRDPGWVESQHPDPG